MTSTLFDRISEYLQSDGLFRVGDAVTSQTLEPSSFGRAFEIVTRVQHAAVFDDAGGWESVSPGHNVAHHWLPPQ